MMKRSIIALACGHGTLSWAPRSRRIAEDAETALKIVYVTHADSGNASWLSVKEEGMDDACTLASRPSCQMLFVTKPGDIQGQVANIPGGRGAVA